MSDASAAGRHFLVGTNGSGQRKHQDLGRPRFDRRLGGGPIAMYSRNTLSGTYEYFRTAALYGGNYKPNVKLEPGSEAVVQNVAGDKFAIGYSSIGYKTDGIRAVPLASYYGAKCYDASAEPTLAGKYPIS